MKHLPLASKQPFEMNMRIWFIGILFSLSGLTLLGQDSIRHELLWEISKDAQSEPSYLFGTMHVADSRVYNLPDSVFLAIQNCEGFALEIDFDTMSYATFAYLYELENGSTWGDILVPEESESDFDDSPERESNLRAILDMFKGESFKHPQEATSLDAFLYRLAKSYKKNITGLESIQEQLGLLADPESGLDDDRATANGRNLSLNRMIEIYERGDLQLLHKYVNESNPEGNFERKVIIARNYVMAKRADSLIQIRPTFLGVGAAHLPGEEGVINLLKERGFKVRPVIATYSGLNKSIREIPYRPDWKDFQRETEGFALKVPTRPYGGKNKNNGPEVYMGMDLPGGVVFTFYANPMDEGNSKAEELAAFERLEISMKDKAYRILESQDTTYLGYNSRRMLGKKGKEYFRSQAVIANGFLYSMFWNGSEEVVKSEITDEWFASLVLNEPLPLSQQSQITLEDSQWRYRMKFPKEHSEDEWLKNNFTDGGQYGIHVAFKAIDKKNRQKIHLHVEDYSSHNQRGKLSERIEDCIYFYYGEELEPRSEFKQIESGGVAGMQGEYLTENDEAITIKCFLEGNRIYFVGKTIAANDPDSTELAKMFDSFEIIPMNLPKLKETFSNDFYEVKFPSKPETWTNNEGTWTPHLDSLKVAYSHDANTSLNFITGAGYISKYYSGSAEDLFFASRDYAIEDSQFVVSSKQMECLGMPAFELITRNSDSSMLDYYKMVVNGPYFLEIDAQVPNTTDGKALGTAFVEGFKPKPSIEKFTLNQSRLESLVSDILSADSLSKEMIEDQLFSYQLLESDYPLAIETILKYELDTTESRIALGLIYNFTQNADSTALPHIQNLIRMLPAQSGYNVNLLIRLLAEPKYNDWALEELRHLATSDQKFRNDYFSWAELLDEDSTGNRVEDLKFMFDSPRLGLDFAYYVVNSIGDEGDPKQKFLPNIKEVLDRTLANYNADTNTRVEKMMMRHILEQIVIFEVDGWQKSALEMARKKGTYIAATGAIILLENGENISKSDIAAVCDNVYARYDMLQWALKNFETKLIPKKYLKNEYLAQVSLEGYLSSLPENLELLEKRSVKVRGFDQDLYVYRFSYKGENEWKLGFAGPFPPKGMPEDLDGLYLSGIAPEPYHPVRLEKQIRSWINSDSRERD